MIYRGYTIDLIDNDAFISKIDGSDFAHLCPKGEGMSLLQCAIEEINSLIPRREHRIAHTVKELDAILNEIEAEARAEILGRNLMDQADIEAEQAKREEE